jgi:hypothetical protein
MYAISQDGESFTQGPVPNFEDIQVVFGESGDKIWHLSADGNIPIYEWNSITDKWVKT